ncbi:MAG: methyltransferase domain-containing protein [Candidatus Shapirobacteria bacterium]|jgi:2-polyprenyl-3-methyl-5-hydroxy-6-metoxy-1,4-benzoquinol methylase
MFLEKFRPNFLYTELKRIFPKYFSVVDIGCGPNSILRLFKNNITYSYGFEIHPQSVYTSKANNIHSEYILDNVLNLKKHFKKKSIDIAFCLDTIEHLKKVDAIKLIKCMEYIAIKKIIIQTTNGYIHQNTYNNNCYQKHLSGFDTKYFREKGYKVLGIDGPYFLRVTKNKTIKERNIFTSILANLLDPIFRYFPNHSLNFLAYKNV